MYNIEELIKETEKKMGQAVEAMIHDFTTYRTGRANPVVLQKVLVDQYGFDVPIQQVATISVPDPRQLMITPFDRNMLSSIEKAIQKSDLNLTPNNDGTNIRLIFPLMSEDRRKELVKQVNGRTEQACINIRNIRRDAIDQAKQALKAKEISEDDAKSHETRIQKITDKHIAETHELQKKKDAELMEV